MVNTNLKPLRSLKELGELVVFDPEFQNIAIGAARDLGGRPSSWHDAIKFLEAYAEETGEEKTIQVVNYCIASKKNRS